jgi:DNA-binding LytR/AlgR family response regulator
MNYLKKIRILIIEDEGLIAEHLKIILLADGFINLRIANDKERALIALLEFKPELVLLDIRMKSPFDGIEIAELLNKEYRTPFIFITAHSDPIILGKALSVKPSAYISKPFNNADVCAAINIAISNFPNQKYETLIVKDGYTQLILNINDILFIKSDKNYIDIYCDKEKHSIRNSLDWILKNIPENHFMQIHRSYIININKINKVSSSTVQIREHNIPISRNLISLLKQRIMNV